MSDQNNPSTNEAPKTEEKVLFEIKAAGRIAYITINNPTKMNSINMDMIKRILELLHQCDENRKIKCVVINSAGDRIFSAGWDLTIFKVFTEQIKHDILTYGRDIARTIFFMKKPVIVQLQGPAIGAGCIISLAADFRFVAKKEGLFFQLPELELGIPGATGPTVNSVTLLGLAQSKRMMLGCEKISLEEMDRWGIITKICDPAEIDSEVKKFSKNLAEKNAMLLYTQKVMCNIIGMNQMNKFYDLENEVADYFFSNKAVESPADIETFLKSLWTKYGAGSP
jgi:enoyl-CoA hydratase/carnithine racemase